MFQDISLEDLGRFNVIVGRNGGGKTALLEALFFLGSMGPELVLKIRRMRGLSDTVSISDETDQINYLWRDFFFNFDSTSTVLLESTGSRDHTRSLLMSCVPTTDTTLPFGQQTLDTEVPRTTMQFLYKVANGTEYECRPSLTKEGLAIGNRVPRSFHAIFLNPVSREGPEHNGQRFSSLSVKGQHKPIVAAIRKHFSFIEDLSVEYHGGIALVHAKLRSVSERVPVPLVSDGVNKMVSILVAVHSFTRGIVLVDEMENGLYFDIMGKASRTILDAAEKSKAQLFVTTHSREYLEALLPLVKARPESFRLLRTTRDNGSCNIDMFDGRHFAAAIGEGLEFR